MRYFSVSRNVVKYVAVTNPLKTKSQRDVSHFPLSVVSTMERPGEFTKCPCCANPWSGDSSNFAMACEPCKRNNDPKSGVDPADFDEVQSEACRLFSPDS